MTEDGVNLGKIAVNLKILNVEGKSLRKRTQRQMKMTATHVVAAREKVQKM